MSRGPKTARFLLINRGNQSVNQSINLFFPRGTVKAGKWDVMHHSNKRDPSRCDSTWATGALWKHAVTVSTGIQSVQKYFLENVDAHNSVEKVDSAQSWT